MISVGPVIFRGHLAPRKGPEAAEKAQVLTTLDQKNFVRPRLMGEQHAGGGSDSFHGAASSWSLKCQPLLPGSAWTLDMPTLANVGANYARQDSNLRPSV